MDPQSEGYDRGRVGGTESSPGMLCGKNRRAGVCLKAASEDSAGCDACNLWISGKRKIAGTACCNGRNVSGSGRCGTCKRICTDLSCGDGAVWQVCKSSWRWADCAQRVQGASGCRNGRGKDRCNSAKSGWSDGRRYWANQTERYPGADPSGSQWFSDSGKCIRRWTDFRQRPGAFWRKRNCACTGNKRKKLHPEILSVSAHDKADGRIDADLQ